MRNLLFILVVGFIAVACGKEEVTTFSGRAATRPVELGGKASQRVSVTRNTRGKEDREARLNGNMAQRIQQYRDFGSSSVHQDGDPQVRAKKGLNVNNF